MPNSQNAVSPEQFAANRANAARSTGRRTPEGRVRSAQNAREHGFAAANYTVVRLEDLQEVANLEGRSRRHLPARQLPGDVRRRAHRPHPAMPSPGGSSLLYP